MSMSEIAPFTVLRCRCEKATSDRRPANVDAYFRFKFENEVNKFNVSAIVVREERRRGEERRWPNGRCRRNAAMNERPNERRSDHGCR